MTWLIPIDGPILIQTFGPEDPETGESPVLSTVEGYHLNTTPEVLAMIPALEPFVVTPSRLRRVWAGDDPENPTETVALRFADEAEAMTVLGPYQAEAASQG